MCHCTMTHRLLYAGNQNETHTTHFVMSIVRLKLENLSNFPTCEMSNKENSHKCLMSKS